MAVSSRPPRQQHPPQGPTNDRRFRSWRAAALLVLAVTLGVGLAVWALRDSGDDARPAPSVADDIPGVVRDPGALLPGAAPGRGSDPLRYTPPLRADRERRAAAGLAHVLYAKSPGGAVRTARRVAALRPKIEKAARGSDVDPDALEGIVFLESAGRPNAIANPRDLSSAAGLTQILAETGTNLLGMKVDVATSARLTRGIARGSRVTSRIAKRRRVDERFDIDKALAASVRYLGIARKMLGGDSELAIVGYHMGIGNLQTALARYGDDDIPFAQLYFGSSPVDHRKAYSFLAGLGDDSSTYLFRVRAAEAIMAQYRSDPLRLATIAKQQTSKNSAEEVLHPEGSVPEYADPFALGRAQAARTLIALDPAALRRYGILISPSMGELAPRLQQSKRLYRALRPEALAVLRYLGAAAQGISGRAPLILTSTIRDRPYQRLLTRSNIQATRKYSLHTTGYTFDIARKYVSRAQSQAFQFALDRLTALNVIAWVREPGAIHITVSGDVPELLPLLRADAPAPAPIKPGG